MKTAEDVRLQPYENLRAIMERMLVAARAGEWDRLVQLEHDCREIVEMLPAEEGAAAPGADTRNRKVELLRQLLALDAAIRDITLPWMRRLETFLDDGNSRRRLGSRYEDPYASRTRS